MRLFQLVQKDKRIRLAPYLLGKLSALPVSDVARRSADQPRDGELFHIFRHINADQAFFVAVNRLGQRLAKLCFSHAGRTGKQHRGDWAFSLR